MIAGEAPGRVESETGKPFVGPSGRLLQECIVEASIPLEALYILNTVKHRPPKNRDPSADERTTCMSKFFAEQVRLVKPKVILCVGRVPAFGVAELAEHKLRSGSVRNQVFEYQQIPVWVTWHPAYIMRNRSKRPELVEDLERAYAYAGGCKE
jgi:uracil-DNA glycosylase